MIETIDLMNTYKYDIQKLIHKYTTNATFSIGNVRWGWTPPRPAEETKEAYTFEAFDTDPMLT